MSQTLALAALALAAAVAAALAVYARRQRGVPAARSFSFMMAAVAVMAAAYALQLRSTDLPTSTFWGNVEYFGIVAVPVGWLAFALEYTGRARILNRRTIALLALIPLATLVLVWTNDAHTLVRRGMRLEPVGALLVPAITRGPWFWVLSVYSYTVLLVGTGLLIAHLFRGGSLARRQAGAAVLAALIPWVSNVLYLARVLPFPYLDPTPFAFTVGGLIVAWNLFAFRLLDLVPVARDALLAGMRDGVIVVDARGRIVEFSPAAETITRRSARSVLGRPAALALPEWPAALTAPLTPSPPASPAASASRPDEDAHVELRLGAGAAQRTYDLRITPLRDPRGVLGGRLAVVRDVTERLRADEERARLLRVQATQAAELVRHEAEAAALRQLDQLKSELLATVSHELRTPLTVVHGYAQRLATSRPVEWARVEGYASRILTSSAQLVHLVEELLDFDRLERGAVAIHPEPLDLAPLLAETLDTFRARPGGLTLTGAWPAPLWVVADRARIEQVIANLLENALSYAGGPITLRARPIQTTGAGSGPRTTTVPTSAASPAALVRTEVVDQGPGIAPEEQPLLWQRFYRGRAVAGLNISRGSGIGLAVVKSLVEAQGGQVGVESAPGLGSCFWFELPAATPHTVPRSQP